MMYRKSFALLFLSCAMLVALPCVVSAAHVNLTECLCSRATFEACAFPTEVENECSFGPCDGVVCDGAGTEYCTFSLRKGVVPDSSFGPNGCRPQYVQSLQPSWVTGDYNAFNGDLCVATNCKSQLQVILNKVSDSTLEQKGASAAVMTFYITQNNDLVGALDYTFDQTTSCGAQSMAAAHIHVGNDGENGPVLWTICQGNCPDIVSTPTRNGGIFVFAYNGAPGLLGASVQNLINNPNGYYINIHTSCAPNGLIRGQVEPLFG